MTTRTTADRDLNHLQPRFRDKVIKWLELCEKAGITIRVTETLRSFSRQAELYAMGRTKPGPRVTNAKPGQSNHHWGLALDCYPIVDGRVDLYFDKNVKSFAIMRRAAELAKECGIKWGIAPLGRPVKDLPHFEDMAMPHLEELQHKYPHGYPGDGTQP